jgi:hypothetical protein
VTALDFAQLRYRTFLHSMVSLEERCGKRRKAPEIMEMSTAISSATCPSGFYLTSASTDPCNLHRY